MDRLRATTELLLHHYDASSFPEKIRLCFATGFWTDRLPFSAAVPVLFSRLGPAVPDAFIEDRRQRMGGQLDFRVMMEARPLFADPNYVHASRCGRISSAIGGSSCSARRSRRPTPAPITRSGSCSECRLPERFSTTMASIRSKANSLRPLGTKSRCAGKRRRPVRSWRTSREQGSA